MHAQSLICPGTDKEITEAMFDIPGYKAPGPDGLTSQFYKDTWPVVGKYVLAAVCNFFLSGKLLKQLNHTLLVLIPKLDHPETVSQYRPIACCNTLYKCITKIILCNRLGRVLPGVISQNQCAFVQGGDIVENILICQDLVRLYGRKSCSPRVLMKIDLQKPYDSIELHYVRHMMEALDLPLPFVYRVMECITSPSFSLVLNRETFGYFQGKRGLRQGDPLSPLLLTISMEYLSRVIMEVQGFEGFRIEDELSKIQSILKWGGFWYLSENSAANRNAAREATVSI